MESNSFDSLPEIDLEKSYSVMRDKIYEIFRGNFTDNHHSDHHHSDNHDNDHHHSDNDDNQSLLLPLRDLPLSDLYPASKQDLFLHNASTPLDTTSFPDPTPYQPPKDIWTPKDDDTLFSFSPDITQQSREDTISQSTLVILDWDDTLLTSTFLDHHAPIGDVQRTEIYKDQLEKLQNIVISFLECVNRIGKVIIITNSEEGWVKLSSEQYMPAVWKCINMLNIPIISARSAYEVLFPMEPYYWKFWAFMTYIQPHHKTLVSFGDAISDHQVTWHVGKYLKNMVVKNIKCLQAPTIDELCDQTCCIISRLNSIHILNCDLEIIAQSEYLHITYPEKNPYVAFPPIVPPHKYNFNQESIEFNPYNEFNNFTIRYMYSTPDPIMDLPQIDN
jgi:hypothetical protein